ncbi:MAG: hypothetical protein M0R74_05770 [Dehalococcoidia bacterium]|nr:hypothetical protein [Dehalococcoidia bacterium]
MKPLACLGLLGVLLLALSPSLAGAQAPVGDGARLEQSQVRIGEQVEVELEVTAPTGATVEVDPAAPSWNGVAVVRVAGARVVEENGSARHLLRVVVAGFLPGQQSFVPAVNVIVGSEVQPRQLPALEWEVEPSLAPDAPLELSPLDPPVAIGGAESPFLRPAVFVGAGAAVLVLLLLVRWAGGRLWQRWRTKPARPVTEPLGPPLLANAEALIGHDPVAAYRELAAIVRNFLTQEHEFPAYALTTLELQQRMEAHGVDRWQARLVGGLLEECDSVVFAGYRPAMERREADLDMAREIVGYE